MENAGAAGSSQKPDDNRSKPVKGKSCKGTLYYSSVLRSKGRNPRCVGLRSSLQQVPSYIAEEAEASNDGRNLSDFKYACLGYSVYPDNDASNDMKDPGAKWPVCIGIELVMDKAPVVDNVSADAHIREEDRSALPRPRPPAPARDEFLTKFARSGNLVALGVAKNMCKVGNFIKDSVDDILYPFKRPPK